MPPSWLPSSLPSKIAIASYVLDWVVIIALAAIGGGLNFVGTKHRPFSLLDLSISFPLVPESISVAVLCLVALVAPAIIISIIVLVFVPGRSVRCNLTRASLIRRRLWEINAGLGGLALSVALGFFITQGLKNIFGKPRPHFIALCQPDLAGIERFVVGGYGQDISARWTLVDSSICTQSDTSMLNDGFRSFPSGHCSFSWSGLLYLSLYLSSKLAIAIPYLPQVLATHVADQVSADTELLPLHITNAGSPSAPNKSQLATTSLNSSAVPIYNIAATPPNYGLILIIIPAGVATYIASTRYVEFWHFGFDVISGSLIGILCAWFSFRWYHLPIRRGQGWAWGPRSKHHAFGIGVGEASYAGPENREQLTRVG